MKSQDPALTKALKRLFSNRGECFPSLLSPQNDVTNLEFRVDNGQHGVFDHQMFFAGFDDATRIALFAREPVFLCDKACLGDCSRAALVEAPSTLGKARKVTRLKLEAGNESSICFSQQDWAAA